MGLFSSNNQKNQAILGRVYPNVWDFVAFSIFLFVVASFSYAFKDIAYPGSLNQQVIDLSISSLSFYALMSVSRMFIALLFSIFLALSLGTLAARSTYAERILLPLIDVLQSVPILGYLSLAATWVATAFDNPVMGFEMVSIFVIVTSQVWNMILSQYQSMKMLPDDMKEVAAVMQLKKIQKFWRIDIPYAMPDLVMNVMISLSAGWFYVVESEVIPLNAQNGDQYLLPGIGSYISKAQELGDAQAVFYALVAMFVVILFYDQLLFRPLSHYVRKYQNPDEEEISRSWVVTVVMRTSWFYAMIKTVRIWLGELLFLLSSFSSRYSYVLETHNFEAERQIKLLGTALLWLFYLVLGYYFFTLVSFDHLLYVIYLGSLTTLRVFSVIFLAIIIWVPIGVWVGLRPKLSSLLEPVIQFFAAFPPNIFYPLLMELMLFYRLDFNVWCAPLMIMGVQWYLLINVISAIRGMPKEQLYVARNMQFGLWLWWKRLILPTIAPHLVVGAMAAAGGAWNAAIVAEVLDWKGQKFYADGLGAYIAENAGSADHQIIGIVVMCIFVWLLNRFFWYRLFRYVEKRFS